MDEKKDNPESPGVVCDNNFAAKSDTSPGRSFHAGGSTFFYWNCFLGAGPRELTCHGYDLLLALQLVSEHTSTRMFRRRESSLFILLLVICILRFHISTLPVSFNIFETC